MKVSENKPHSVHLRLTDEQYQFLSNDADMLGIGISDYVRMIINTTMYTCNKFASKLAENAEKLGDLENADNTNNIKH